MVVVDRSISNYRLEELFVSSGLLLRLDAHNGGPALLGDSVDEVVLDLSPESRSDEIALALAL